MNRIFNLLFSTRLMAMLFIVFAAAMGIATFIENDYGTQTSKALVYNTWWFEGIMVMFLINFIGNIKRYQLLKKEKWVILILHVSFIFILIGAGVTRYISHEGIMPIKEGETTDQYMSEKIYLGVTVDNGEVQKNTIYDPILLSAWGKNSYQLKTNFKDQDITIKIKNYIPNAEEKFIEGADGQEYLHFVESGSGERHDHYLPKGEKQVIHNVMIGFESDGDAMIEFKEVDGVLQMVSAVDGSYFRMADKASGLIKKDSLANFNLLSLHTLGGLQFVVPALPKKGTYETQTSDDRDAFPSDLVTFEITTNGKSKEVNLMGGKFMVEKPTIVQVGGLTFRMTYGARQLELPFSIRLNEFELENYPGSESPMSYSSEVTVIDPEETFDYRIFMNHILDFKGYKFFQASFRITDEYQETHLSVNHDFWGTSITYFGYTMLYISLVLIMVLKNTRVSFLRNQLKKFRKKKAKLMAIVAFIAVSSMNAQAPHELNESQTDSIIQKYIVAPEHAEKFSALVIQDAGGRMKPLHTFSNQFLRKISGSDHFKGMNSSQAFLSIVQNPRLWFQVPVIKLDPYEKKLKKLIGVPEDAKYARLIDFFDQVGNYKLADPQLKAFQKSVKNKFDKNVIKVDQRVNLLYSAIGGGILRIFPIPEDETNKWVSHPELNEASFSGIDSVFVRQIMPVYIQMLGEAEASGDYKQVDDILEGIHKFQQKNGGAVYPSEGKINLEIAYNKIDIFSKLLKYYILVGVLMMIFVIWQILSDKKFLRILIQICTAFIALFFLAHTAGLAARWYISGHAPWSNAYESVVYVGWATMLFGLVYGRRSALTTAAAAFLTGFILWAAYLNQLDPEIGNLVPVLNSWWLMVHVAIIVASYGPFALSMILGLLNLFLMIFTTKKSAKKIGLHIKELTAINEISMTAGLVLLAIGNFLGGMWANESWGRYWGWDPKETWALISIMIYAFVLHTRLVPGLRGRFSFNFMSVAAFYSILMTYFGVNFYLSGLHSYASGDKTITPAGVYYSIGILFVITALAFYKYKKYQDKIK